MQKNNLHQNKYSISYFIRLLMLCAIALPLVIFTLADTAAPYVSCVENDTNGVGYSPKDTIKVMRVTARPGDTLVWVPIYCRTDSIMSGFRFLLDWDRTKVTPSVVVDTFPNPDIYFVRTQLAGRLLQVNPQNPNDTTTNFYSQIIHDPITIPDSAMICAYNLSPDSPLVTTPPGSGVIFRVGFRLFGNVLDGDSARVFFPTYQPVLIIPPNQPIILDCILSEISSDWRPSPIPVVLYPRPVAGYIVADVTPPAEIGLFAAQPATISVGNGSALRYIVTNADSVRINGPSGYTFGSSTVFDGQQIVTPTVTSNYTMIAYGVDGNDTATTTVTVTTGGGGPNPNAPIISFPDGNSFTIEQGQTVSFRVRATDADVGSTVTLRASSLPNNANFVEVVGAQTVEGTFSFTPDFNQSGTFSITFIATDNTLQSNSSTAIVVVEELQFDRLFSTSALGQSPVGGLKGKKDVVFPINMVTQQTVYGVQFDMAYDANALKLDSFVVTARTPDYLVSDNIGGSPGQVRVVTFGLANDSVITDTSSTAILNSYWSLDSEAVPWTDYLIDMTDGWESIDPNPAFPSLPMVTDPGIIQVDNPGDVNLDKRIDVADLVNIVAYIIGNFGLPNRQFETADIIRNDSVNVFDLVATLNTIFGIPISPVPPPPISGRPAVLALEYNNLYAGQTDLLVVKADLPERVAAAELEVKYDKSVVALSAPQLGVDAQNRNMALQYKIFSDGTMKIVLYFASPLNVNDQIPAGSDIEMITIPMLAQRVLEAGNKNQLKLNKAVLSTSSSASIPVEGIEKENILPESFELYQNYPNPFNPYTTIEFSIGASDNGATTLQTNLDIYNILGQRVKTLINEELPAGRYRVEWDATNDSRQKVATGVYFYRLVVGEYSQSKKMLLIK